MSGKKSKKPVMVYDPLAWLKPESTDDSSDAKEDDTPPEVERSEGAAEVVETEQPNTATDTPTENTVEVEAQSLVEEPVAETEVVEPPVVSEPLVEKKEMSEASSETPPEPSSEEVAGDTSENGLLIEFESRANIAHVEALYKTMHDALREGQHIKLNAENVEVVDTSILQLLVCFIQEIQNVSGSFEWVGVSDSFKSAAELINVDHKLAFAD